MAKSKDKNTGNQDTGGTPITIKKYPNRRLYNTATSSHIVLDDLVELVKSGEDFVVVDAKTGEDITRSILNQVIYEREANGQNHHFPLDVQKQLIAMYDDAYARMVPDYLRESMNLFVSQRDKFKDSFEEMLSINSQAMSEFNQNLARQNMEFFNRSFEFFQSLSGMKPGNSNAQGQTGDKPVKEEAVADDKTRQLSDIQAQIDALQDHLKSLK